MPDWDSDSPTAWDDWLTEHAGAILLVSLLLFALAMALSPGGW